MISFVKQKDFKLTSFNFSRFPLIMLSINYYSNIIAMEIYINGIVVGDTTSSTDSNDVINGEEVTDDATSNSINKNKFQPKAERFIHIISIDITVYVQRSRFNVYQELKLIYMLWSIYSL